MLTLFVPYFKIKIRILQERTGSVNLSEEQEKVYVDHFLTHGITPKQFELIDEKATKFQLKKGQYLIRKGEKLNNVYLVIQGTTKAHILGRHLTAGKFIHELKSEQTVDFPKPHYFYFITIF